MIDVARLNLPIESRPATDWPSPDREAVLSLARAGSRGGWRLGALGVFVAEVRPRWSDMDAFGHVNHANVVTLLEEARVDLLFGEASRQGAAGMRHGVVLARLVVDYHTPLVADGTSVRVEIVVRELRAASFTLDYVVHSGRRESDAVVATAETMLVPYDRTAGRPRRLTDEERDFLAGYRAGGVRSA